MKGLIIIIDVVGIGVPCVDLIASVNELPVTGKASILQDYSWQGGGKVSTALVTIARLGAVCSMYGVIGDDLYGQFCTKDLKHHNVLTEGMVVVKNGKTPFSIVLSEKTAQERSFLYDGGNLKDSFIESVFKMELPECRYLHLADPTKSNIHAAKKARSKGARVVYDGDYFKPELYELLPHLDVFIGSDYCYSAMFSEGTYNENMLKVLEMGPSIVVFTLGSKGCLVLTGDKLEQVPSFKVEVADTTGAGDVFHGAFIFGLLQGWDAVKTARFANAVSAIKCTKMGGRAGIPNIQQVETFLETGRIDSEELLLREEYYRYGIFRSFGEE